MQGKPRSGNNSESWFQVADEQGQRDGGAGSPRRGAQPIGGGEPANEGGLVTGGKAIVERDLQEPGAGPNGGEQEHAGEGEGAVGAGGAEAKGGGGRELDEHDGGDDEGGAALVLALVSGEVGVADGTKERVVDDLDEPDETGHEPGGRGVHGEDGGVGGQRLALVAVVGDSFCSRVTRWRKANIRASLRRVIALANARPSQPSGSA